MNLRNLFVALFAFVFSTYAHPGHDLMAHGPAHVATSVYHLWVLGIVALVSLGIAQVVRQPVVRRALRITGASALLLATALWSFGL